MAEESAVVYSKLDEWLRELLASDYELEPTPASPEEAKSPDWSRIALERRQSRKLERDGMKLMKSPVLEPKKHGLGVIDMVDEGIRLVAAQFNLVLGILTHGIVIWTYHHWTSQSREDG